MTVQHSDLWVDEKNGLVSRDVFVSEDVFKIEVERIFNRVWLYLAHDSEIPSPGDFVTRNLAGTPVIVVRERDGSVKVFLNSCAHRGAKVCRVDSGNARTFVCPYHGWAYDLDGSRIKHQFDALFPADTDFSKMGLVQAPRVETYKGFIFGSWNNDVVDLGSYLGDFKWYFDLIFARTKGGVEVLGPPQRFRVKTNWKIAAINFGTDNQHVFSTHIGPASLQKGPIPRPEVAKAMQTGALVVTKNGHTISSLCTDALGPFVSALPEMVSHYQETLSPDQQSVVSSAFLSVGTVFPNMSFLDRYLIVEQPRSGSTITLRLWQPVSAHEMEIISWAFAEKEAPADFKKRSFNDAIRNFGVAGVFEQEDVELWSDIVSASSNPIARAHPLNFQTALPTLNRPSPGFIGPGEAYRPALAETSQFKFFQHWNRLMETAP